MGMFRSPLLFGAPKVCADGKWRPRYPDGIWTPPPAQLVGAAASRAAVSAALTAGSGGIFATEAFATKTLNAAPNWLDTDTGGVTWGDNFYTKVVNSPSYDGSRSLEFAFGAYNGSIAEQRFELNRALPEVWIGYRLFIPANYAPANKTGSGSDWAGGNKELVLYSQGYSNTYPTMILGSWYKQQGAGSGDGSMWQSGSMSYINQSGARVYHQFDDYDGRPKLIDASFELNTWQYRIGHLKMPTTATSNDGVCEYWVQRSNGVTDKIVDVHNGAWYGANPGSTGNNLITGGYILGAAGTLWASDMKMAIARVTWSTTNVWGVS